ncbi:MAG: hypothetical protein M1820_005234 [Bogoriella megaspora]|nr:MAG: hypothetical protein M1820_005234 [Bogoriella megaspora]
MSQNSDRRYSVRAMARNFSLGSQSSQLGSGGYESDQSSDMTDHEPQGIQRHNAPVPLMWQRPDRLSQKLGNTLITVTPVGELPDNASQTDDESRDSTLADDEQNYDFPEKTPTAPVHVREIDPIIEDALEGKEVAEEPVEEPPAPHIPGPLEQQLAALMSKVIFFERENPTIAVSPEEYRTLQNKVATLEAEKIDWMTRHAALYALRDEDIANIIKLRGLLAAERFNHEGIKKLRDEDLQNVLALRAKLADATRKIQRLEGSSSSASGVSSPVGARSSTSPRERPRSIALERRDTSNDLFQAARTAALEQRALELEKANAELLAKLEKDDRKTDVSREQAWQGALGSEKEVKVLRAENGELKNDRLNGDKAWRSIVQALEEQLKGARSSKEDRKADVEREKVWQRALDTEKEIKTLQKENEDLKKDKVQGDKAWRAVVSGLEGRIKNSSAPSVNLTPSPAISHPASWSSATAQISSALSPSSTIRQAPTPAPATISAPAASPDSTKLTAIHNAHATLLKQVESVHEENASLRERMTQRVQKLRTEKEALQREVHAKEDDHAELERKFVRLQRKVDGGCSICGN